MRAARRFFAALHGLSWPSASGSEAEAELRAHQRAKLAGVAAEVISTDRLVVSLVHQDGVVQLCLPGLVRA